MTLSSSLAALYVDKLMFSLAEETKLTMQPSSSLSSPVSMYKCTHTAIFGLSTANSLHTYVLDTFQDFLIA